MWEVTTFLQHCLTGKTAPRHHYPHPHLTSPPCVRFLPRSPLALLRPVFFCDLIRLEQAMAGQEGLESLEHYTTETAVQPPLGDGRHPKVWGWGHFHARRRWASLHGRHPMGVTPKSGSHSPARTFYSKWVSKMPYKKAGQ